MKYVLVSDYDNTFYLNDLDIKKNIELVKRFREKGNIFIFATGRSYFDFMKKKDRYNLEYDYVILDHGATIINDNDEVLYSCYIDEDYNKLKEALELNKSYKWFCCSQLLGRVNFDCKKISKMAVYYLPFVNVKEKKQELDFNFKNIKTFLASRNMIEVVSKDADKSNGINLLIKKLNIDKKYVYTVGDYYTDIEMVEKFNGYCMKNSVKELKVVASNEIESVSVLINELINQDIK